MQQEPPQPPPQEQPDVGVAAAVAAVAGNRLLSAQAVADGLAAGNPSAFARALRSAHGLEQDPSNRVLAIATPLMDVLGVSRSELHRSLLQNLVSHMLVQIPRLLQVTIPAGGSSGAGAAGAADPRDKARLGDQEKLTELLRKSLPYLVVSDLREIPLRLLALHPDPPPDILPAAVEIGGPTFLDELPVDVRERLLLSPSDFFENSKIRILISKYIAVEADIFSLSEEMTHQVDKRYRFNIGPITRPFLEAIGKSNVLYKRAIDVIREEYKSSRDTRLCTLRSDLIMAYHDLTVQDKKKYQGILETDNCYRLAYYLDTFTKQKTPIPDLERRLDEIFTTLGKLDPRLTFTPLAPANDPKSKKRPPQESPRPGENSKAKAPPTQNALNSIFKTCLDKIKDCDPTALFDKPVMEQYPLISAHYKSLVSHPMDITTMRNKLRDKKYKSFDEIRADLNLIFDNCVLYNGDQFKQQAQTFLTRSLKVCLLAEQEYLKTRHQDQQRQASQSNHVNDSRPEDKSTDEHHLSPHEINGRNFALIDAAMMLSDSKVVNALIRSLLACVQHDVIEMERLPREVQVLRSLLHLLVIGDSAGYLANANDRNLENSTVRASPRLHLLSFPKYGKENGESLNLEKHFLPELILLRLSTANRSRLAAQSKNANESEIVAELAPDSSALLQMMKESFLSRHIIFHLFFETLRIPTRRDYGSLAKTILEMCEAADVKSQLVGSHPGFLLSLSTALSTDYQQQQQQQQAMERKASVQAISQQQQQQPHPDPSTQVTRLQLLRRIILPALEAICIASPTLTLLAHAHEQFARVMSSPMTVAELDKNDYLQILKEGVSFIGVESDQLMQGENIDELQQQQNRNEVIMAKYLSPDFANARQLYETIFVSDQGIRDFCNAPSEALVKDLSTTLPSGLRVQTGASPSPSPGISPGALMSN